jgi:hypothetical protein
MDCERQLKRRLADPQMALRIYVLLTDFPHLVSRKAALGHRQMIGNLRLGQSLADGPQAVSPSP